MSTKYPDYITLNAQEKCFMARIQRHRKREQENFAIKKHGGESNALKAAEEWVTKMLPKLPEKLSSKNRMTVRNHSGVVGVHFDSGQRVLPSGNRADYPGYVARWPGCAAGLRWSFSTYNGPENAFVHAVICRRMESRNRTEVEDAVRIITPHERSEILSIKKIETE